MFKKMKLSVKLICSFVIVSLITLLIGFFGWRGVNSLTGNLVEIGEVRLPAIQSLLIIQKEAESVRVFQRTLLNPNLTSEERARQFEHLQKIRERYQKAWKTYESLPQSPEVAVLWNKSVTAWDAWHQGNNEFVKLIRELEKLDLGNPAALNATLEMIRGDHYKLMVNTAELLDKGTLLKGGEDHLTCNYGKWVASFKTQNSILNSAIANMTDPHRLFHQSVADIKAAVGNGDLEKARHLFKNSMQPAAERVFKGLRVMRGESQKAVMLFDKAGHYAMVTAREKQIEAIDSLEKIVKITDELSSAAVKAAVIESGRSKTIAVIGMIAGFLAALTFGIVLSISITSVLTRIIKGLSEGANQVASASGQVSSSSQSLAEGSSEQAASIEETSSSMEEMASMTKKNAENSTQADTLMKDANQIVITANDSMEHLTRSMEDISKASEETSKIIKTIDEIAFQTNLLALNAAVEAARAGEAGAGFAVVADEVRNLAMRAADAAKNTAQLIEGTVKKVNGGSEIVVTTSEAFARVAETAGRVGEIIAEISGASDEQANGIDQVNLAITEMDKVVQQNAANAEESASAAEEMSGQAEQLKDYVGELMMMVTGNKDQQMGTGRNRTVKTVSPHLQPSGSGKKQRLLNNSKEVKPEQVIPFDEDDFKDF